MRVLQIIEPAYRATMEEQDDTVLWFTRAIRAAGAPADVLLCATAVNYSGRARTPPDVLLWGTAVKYSVRGQDAEGFHVGGWSQHHPPAIEHEITKLIESGARGAALGGGLRGPGAHDRSYLT